MSSITIHGDLNATDIEEILMTIRAIERRDPQKQIAVLVEGGQNKETAIAMLKKMFDNGPTPHGAN